ncbi:MAG: hypothetical protein WCN81_00600 [Actinomycetes bacterium]
MAWTRVLLRDRQEIQPEDGAAEKDEQPLLPVDERQAVDVVLQVRAPALERAPHGSGGRVRRLVGMERADLVPNHALVAAVPAAGAHRRVDAHPQARTDLVFRHIFGGDELPRLVRPAALLGTAHGDHQTALLADEDRRVEHAVLLGAAQLFTVEDEHARLTVVVDAQVRHGAALVDLGHAALPGLGRLTERDVPRPAARVRTQRDHVHGAEGLDLAELQQAGQPRSRRARRALPAWTCLLVDRRHRATPWIVSPPGADADATSSTGRILYGVMQ